MQSPAKTGAWSRGYTGIIAALSSLLLATSACAPSPAASITVNPDGTFTPNQVAIQAGESVQWTNLSRTDAIVQIADPSLFPNSDPCGVLDDELDHVFDGNDPNEFTGPRREAVSGIFALSQNEAGFVQRPSTETCACETAREPCTPRQVNSLDGNSYKLCPGEGAPFEVLDATWSNPDLTGVILRLNWSDIQVVDDLTGEIEFHWDDLDREMNRAVESGKLFTLDVRAGKGGTPDWIFDTYEGPAGPGPVSPLGFKDWGSERAPPGNDCGFTMVLGSPVDPSYRELYTAMLDALAAHVASDSRWFQALAHVKLSGANFISSEARLPNRCYDGDGDGVLDIITDPRGQTDRCLCNSRTWAQAEPEYTPAGLYEYYRVVGNTVFNAFFQRKSLGYQLIQAGFPRVESATNFEGDALQDQNGNDLLSPPGVASDDINGFIQTETVLQEGREGRFVDPTGATTDPVAARLFVPQHSGLGRLPEDDGRPGCNQAVSVGVATPPAALFPIATNTPGDRVHDGCPNRWAVEEGTLFSQIMGFQTQNPETVTSPGDLESTLWNLTINSNGVFLEIYEQVAWEVLHTRGSGETAAVLDANRVNLMGNPAPYSKNLFTWTEELHGRRKDLADPSNAHLRDPFPGFHQHTFSNASAAPVTYYFVNPSTCGQTHDPARVGQITVTP
jgi:plastocyanin